MKLTIKERMKERKTFIDVQTTIFWLTILTTKCCVEVGEGNIDDDGNKYHSTKLYGKKSLDGMIDIKTVM